MNNSKTKIMTMKEIQDELGFDVEIVDEQQSKYKKIALRSLKPGSVFKDNLGREWILLSFNKKTALCITRKAVFKDKFDNQTNNFYQSQLHNRLKKEILPSVIEAFGEKNVLEFETDLTSDDCLNDYGKFNSRISLLTDMQYRAFNQLINPVELTAAKKPVDDWWWLATPLSTPKRGETQKVRCVLDTGALNFMGCYGSIDVRPVCVLKSSVHVFSNKN